MRELAIVKKLLIIVLVLSGAVLHAQNDQDNFTFGKELFRDGRYELAMQSFRKAMTPAPNNPYAPYASFYNALSAYKLGQVENSRNLFIEVSQRFADWEKVGEVYYWLATTYFEEGNATSALDYLNRVKQGRMSPDIRKLKEKYLAEIQDITQLKVLYKSYPSDTIIAKELASKISRATYNNTDQELLKEIASKFGFEQEKLGLVDLSKSVKKKEYNIAVMLPFMFSSLEENKANLRTDLVTDLYTGMLLGAEQLRKENKKVVIHAYDEKRSGPVTSALLKLEELKRMDLIVGPLYPEPSRLVSEFSSAFNINMINPVSANPEVIGNNSYSFLMRPTYLTQAVKAADYVSEKFTGNKNFLVFYENNPRDSAAAYLYSERLKEKDFVPVKIKALRPSEAHYLIDTLSFKKEVEIRSKAKLDSMLGNPQKHIVKSRNKSFGNDSTVYYEEVWKLKRDSVGHIFVASSNALLATNIISAVEIRPDTIPVIGRDEWLEIPQVNYEQVERIGALFISPAFIDKDLAAYENFFNTYLSRYKAPPSVYACQGYELMVVFGRLMHQNGNYFQAGLSDRERVDGALTPGFEYGFYNDNQVVTFLKIVNGELVKEVR